MTAPRKAIRALSSKELLVWLAGAWIIYYVTSAMVQGEAFGKFINALSTGAAARVPYVLFVLCLVLNIVRSFRERWKAGPLKALSSIVLPIGVVVFLSGFFISAVYRQFMWVQVGEGQVVRAEGSRTMEVGPISPALERKTLQAEEEGLIFAFEPKVKLSDGRGVYTVGAFPPTRIGNAYYHILDFGLAPGVRLEREGSVIEDGYVMLRILPPGAQDTFTLQPLPYAFLVNIVPEETVQRGDARMKLFDIGGLDYEVEIRRGDETVFEGTTTNGRLAFDGIDMSFREPTYWVLLDIVKDPGRSILITGLFVIALGLPLWIISLFIRRREAV